MATKKLVCRRVGGTGELMPFPFTHYHVSDDGTVTLLVGGKCERCGEFVQEPNAVGGSLKDVEVYRVLGLVALAQRPPEVVWVDELAGTACEDCWG